LDDYLKAINLLTNNDHKSTLQERVQELTEKSKEELHIFKGQSAEKERESEKLKKKVIETKKRRQYYERGNKYHNEILLTKKVTAVP